MRTTISLSDGLAEDLKRRAAEQGVSLSSLIESLLRAALHAKPSPRKVPRFRLVTVGGSGVVPGVDLDRAARIAEADDVAAGSLAKAGR
jgi:hypothetical protein